MPRANLLGDFLRARRAQLQPEEAGVSVRGGRRVPGLRREELALLAGVSTDYYTRLEQGRSLPSVQVTEALARALMLDSAATHHLHELARAPKYRPHGDDTLSSDRLQALLDQWPTTPAWASDRHAQVIAANALATTLNPECTPGGSMLRALFLDEAGMREHFVDYDDVAAAAVASLRARNGAELDDSQLTELVSELSNKSTHFARLWSRHDVRFHVAAVLNIVRLRHPDAGPMEFQTESMLVNGRAGTLLTVYYADPDSVTARKLSELSSTTPRLTR
jgi:transcriptional regulator with XRE-family HTH domain